MLRLFNTASRRVEELQPVAPPKVGLYTCGPTVYFDAHIGNFRTYVFEDVLLRALRMEGYEVRRVLNVTDVGHLVGDGDDGEDKVHKAAIASGKTAWDIAKTYTDLFLGDARMLNIEIPEAPYLSFATAHIPEQIEIVERLEKNGFTYRTSDGIYFDTSKFPDYGRLSGQRLEEKLAGARVEVGEKHQATDFALWKFSYPNGVDRDAYAATLPAGTEPAPARQMEWESPWGIGFPGWHIECSAMARKYLGQPFDIHCGGIDHVPVHHENEIAQSEAAYGVPLAKVWMHAEFLSIDGQKMSKSLKNIYTVRDIAEKGFDPMALRLFYLGAHYRQKQNFTFEALQASQNALAKLRQIARDLPALGGAEPDAGAMDGFRAAIEDDLNTAVAVAELWKALDEIADPAVKAATVIAMDGVLGLGLAEIVGHAVEVPSDVAALVEKRLQARADKDWAASDRLRDEIAALGWIVEDGKAGAKVHPKG